MWEAKLNLEFEANKQNVSFSFLIERWYDVESSRQQNEQLLQKWRNLRRCRVFKCHKYQWLNAIALRSSPRLNMVIQNWMVNGLFKWWFKLSICCYYTRCFFVFFTSSFFVLGLREPTSSNYMDPLKLFFTRHQMDNRPYQSTHHPHRKRLDCAGCHRPTLNRRLLAAFACAWCVDFGTRLWPNRSEREREQLIDCAN